MSWEGLNRRKFPRAKFPCLVKLAVNGVVRDAFLAHTENISTGGVCVILKKGMERFTPMDVEIDLMDGEDHFCVKGKAVWVVRRKATEAHKASCYDTGIEFVDMTEENDRRIRQLVEHIVRNELKVKL